VPGANVEDGNRTCEEAGAGCEDPGPGCEDPSAGSEDPGANVEDGNRCCEEPGNGCEDPSAGFEEPGADDNDGICCCEEPAPDDNDGICCCEEPAPDDNDGTTACDEPGPTVLVPGATEEEAAGEMFAVPVMTVGWFTKVLIIWLRELPKISVTKTVMGKAIPAPGKFPTKKWSPVADIETLGATEVTVMEATG